MYLAFEGANGGRLFDNLMIVWKVSFVWNALEKG